MKSKSAGDERTNSDAGTHVVPAGGSTDLAVEVPRLVGASVGWRDGEDGRRRRRGDGSFRLGICGRFGVALGLAFGTALPRASPLRHDVKRVSQESEAKTR